MTARQAGGRAMIALGSDVIIIEVEKARKLLKLLDGKSKQDIKRLQKQGVLSVINELRKAIRGYDSDRRAIES